MANNISPARRTALVMIVGNFSTSHRLSILKFTVVTVDIHHDIRVRSKRHSRWDSYFDMPGPLDVSSPTQTLR